MRNETHFTIGLINVFQFDSPTKKKLQIIVVEMKV